MTIEANNIAADFAAAFPLEVANAQNTHDNEEIQTEGGVAAAAIAAAAAEEVHNYTGTTQSVEDSHIVTNTRNTYNRSLTAL